MLIRRADIRDLLPLQQLYVETILSVCRAHYEPDQLLAWASGTQNKQRWENLLKEQFVLIAEENNQIAGFISLDKGSYIDMIFVNKRFIGKGVGKALYKLIEKEAISNHSKQLTANVSITARPFFEKAGFDVVAEQVVKVKGFELKNYNMRKIFFP